MTTGAGTAVGAGAWTPDAMGDQSGRTVLVTGANSGLGFHVATEFARRGADVLLACRNAERARAALARLDAEVADSGRRARAEVVQLDTADLASVRRAADIVLDNRSSIDVLVNNAGVMVPPLSRTADGFELQVGTNHLGHFAFTGRLLPALLAGDGARVVSVSSVAHRFNPLDRENYQSETSYSKWHAYGQSKLSNLLFALELNRRAGAAGAPITSVAAHPGVSDTNLWKSTPLGGSKLGEKLGGVVNKALGHPSDVAAWPLERAATEPDLLGGEFFGPDGFMQWRGFPVHVPAAPHGYDPSAAAWLWARSVEWTGVDFAALGSR
ncbi:oxidoreductase [Kineococcus gynurae]|uniref:Oxidoreductase n=1 Tax=Kineococcus gynurae TaxID=452979 RepID=A0ABV5LTF6_9ACTN